jgi:hypothetical protein
MSFFLPGRCYALVVFIIRKQFVKSAASVGIALDAARHIIAGECTSRMQLQ